jgi:antitoxin component of MazEF toxin-antitoxin module
MVRTITKIGNSCGLIFDRTLLDLTHLKLGDEVNIKVHDGGSVTIEPVREKLSSEAFSSLVKEVLQDYSTTLKKLS